MQMCRTL